MRRSALALAAALAVAFALGGCGGGESAPADAPKETSGQFPATVKAADGEVTVPERPTKIVSLSPTATEMLFGIDAGRQIVATDELSNFPQNAPRTKLSGFKPNADAIAGYDPDLVVLSYDANDVVASLRKLKIPVYLAPAATTLDDSYRQITDLGTLTGNTDPAADLVTRMKADIEKLTRDLPKRTEPLTYYYELDPQLHSVASMTFIGSVFTLAGLQNIADKADKEGTGYPKLAAEYVIDSDPDLIFLADTKCCGQSPETVAKRPGWDKLSAVRGNGVHSLDDDIASRWGPRVVDLLKIAVDAAASAKP